MPLKVKTWPSDRLKGELVRVDRGSLHGEVLLMHSCSSKKLPPEDISSILLSPVQERVSWQFETEGGENLAREATARMDFIIEFLLIVFNSNKKRVWGFGEIGRAHV